MDDAAARAALAYVQPQLSQLRVTPTRHDGSVSCADATGVWLTFEMGEYTSQFSYHFDDQIDQDLHALETLELLTLLSRADRSVWATAAQQLKAVHDPVAWTSRVLACDLPPAVVGYELMFKATATARVFSDALEEPTEQVKQRARAFWAVRAPLEAATRARGATTSIPVRFRLPYGQTPDYTSLIFPKMSRRNQEKRSLDAFDWLLRLAKFQQRVLPPLDEETMQQRGINLRGRVCEVYDRPQPRDRRRDIDHSPALTDFDGRILEEILELHGLGVRVVDLPHVEMTQWTLDSSTHVRALHELLGISHGRGIVERVTIDTEKFSTARILSAVAESSSVHEVHFTFRHIEATEPYLIRHKIFTHQDAEREDRLAVQWMAYALFSVHANNPQLAKIVLNCEMLKMHHVELIRAMLGARDPMRTMVPRYLCTIQSYGINRMLTTRAFLWDPTTHSTSGRPAVKSTTVRVLDRIFDGLIVLLPGWGIAWVPENHGVFLPVDTDLSNGNVRSIEHLELCTGQHHDGGPWQDNRTATRALLQLVGHRVKSLRINDTRGVLSGSYAAVLATCSALQQLDVNDINSHGWPNFVECFTSGCCTRLCRLRLHTKTLLLTGLRQVHAVLIALTDPAHAMAQQLEHLEVHAEIVDATRGELCRVLDDALRVLQTNTHLVRLQLRLFPASSAPSAEVLTRLQALAQYDGTMLDEPAGPVSARQQAAFFSVLWRKVGYRMVPSAALRVDGLILATIFAFAVDRRRRSVDVGTTSAGAAA